jgi:hypothetical protein
VETARLVYKSNRNAIDVGQFGIRLVALQVGYEPQARKAGWLPVQLADKSRQHVLTDQHARGDLLGCGANVVEQILPSVTWCQPFSNRILLRTVAIEPVDVTPSLRG